MTMPLQLSWDRAGSGEPLLLLHGIGSTHRDFAALRPRLDARYAVLAPDLPGLGDSAPLPVLPTVAAIADALEADLDTLGLDRVHVLGSSLGGRLALELAVRGRARSVVALAPSGLNLPVERLNQGLTMGAMRLTVRALRPLLEAATRYRPTRAPLLTGLRSMPWLAGEDDARAMVDGFGGSPDFWRLLKWAILADVPSGLDRIDCPVRLAQGTADVIASGQTPRYLALIPGARFQPLVGAGHAPQSDAPGAILSLVREATAAARGLDDGRVLRATA